jgi:Zn-dependent protease
VLKLLALALGALKLGKVGGTIITMLISLGAYSLLFGWRYAAGFLGLLLLHEMGHYIAARERGLQVGAPTFIPFVGAWIQLKDQPMDVATEAYVAVAGPFVGTIAATAVYFWGRETHSNLLLAIAYGGFFLNFFNLVPLSPLDGGRITAILSPRIWFLGVPIIVTMMLIQPSPLLIMIIILAIPALVKAWNYDPTAPENLAYYNAPLAMRIEYGIFYLGLVAYLGVMTDATHSLVQGSTGGRW